MHEAWLEQKKRKRDLMLSISTNTKKGLNQSHYFYFAHINFFLAKLCLATGSLRPTLEKK